MTATYRVRFWDITHRRQKGHPYGVREVVSGLVEVEVAVPRLSPAMG